MTRRRTTRYGGDASSWPTPTPEDRAAAERMLHRPHEPRHALAYARPAVPQREGYVAPSGDYAAYWQCRICLATWPCPHAHTCVVDNEPWPCPTVNGDTTP